MSDRVSFVRRLLGAASPPPARSADETAAYLNKMAWDEKMLADPQIGPALQARLEAEAAEAARNATVPMSTAEQLQAAGLPLPAAARRLVNAADADMYPGPDAAALREWIDSQTPEPRAIPRGSQRTALDTIRDSWDTMTRGRVDARAAAQRRPVEILRAAGRGAMDLASGAVDAAGGAGRGAAGVVRGMGPMPLAVAGVGTAMGIAATRAARQQKADLAAAAEERRQQDAERASSAADLAAAEGDPDAVQYVVPSEPINDMDGFDPVATLVLEPDSQGVDPLLMEAGLGVLGGTAPAVMRDGRPVPNSSKHYQQLKVDAANNLGAEPHDGLETEAEAKARFERKWGAGEWDKVQAQKARSRQAARPAAQLTLPPRRRRPLDAGG